jgi:hypothetical protein
VVALCLSPTEKSLYHMNTENREQPEPSKRRSLTYNTTLIGRWVRQFIFKAVRNCVTCYEVVPQVRFSRNIDLQQKEPALSFIE